MSEFRNPTIDFIIPNNINSITVIGIRGVIMTQSTIQRRQELEASPSSISDGTLGLILGLAIGLPCTFFYSKFNLNLL